MSAVDERKLIRATKTLFGVGKAKKKKADFVKSIHWRDKRPLTVGNWAVPEHLEKTPDLDEWKREDMEKYFLKFVTADDALYDDEKEDLAEKIKYLVHASKADFQTPLQECCVDHEVNTAVATLACYRTEDKEDSCIVKHPEDEKFYIPQLGIAEAMERAAQRNDRRSMIQQLQGVHTRRSSTVGGPGAGDGDEGEPEAKEGGDDDGDEAKAPAPPPEPETPLPPGAAPDDDSEDY